MIDPVLLRENPDLIKRSQEARGESVALVDAALLADVERRSAIASFEELRAEQNLFGKKVAAAPKDEKKELVAQAQELAARVKAAQQASNEAEEAFGLAIRALGNPIIDGVPAGGEDDFVTIRTVGTKPEFDFEPRDHLEIGELLGGIDMARGAKVSGARFYYLKGVVARLEIALMNMALDRALAAGLHAAHHADPGQARDHAGHRLPR